MSIPPSVRSLRLFGRVLAIFILGLTAPQGARSASDPQKAYHEAIADARVAEYSEISHELTVVLPGQEDTEWTNIDGEEHVFAVTWTSWDGFDELVGSSTTLSRQIWITLVPQVADFCSSLDLAPQYLDLRLEQLLGLPPDNGKTRFVEFWVKPDDLFRPCPDPEIDDSHCDLAFPSEVGREHVEWFDKMQDESYGENGYPWTRLGYTYDWNSSTGEVGLSEFVVSAGAIVKVASVDSTSVYCQR